MAHQLRPVGLDFVDTAPVRLVFGREMRAAPKAVFRALAEDVPGWSRWLPGVRSARPTERGREVRLRGGVRFEETVLASTAPEVYAYRVDAANVPGARAWLEEWHLTAHGTGTRVRMTFALDGAAPFLAVCRLAAPGMGRAIREGIRALDAGL
ncbi:SRPBCC family protein [Streptomyces sp. NPDC001068]|uniref:SRPBCC family protein n=1 Tax=Streptomyces sp. NPDC001068 TaxID=3364544 RepID=UPI00368BF2B6